VAGGLEAEPSTGSYPVTPSPVGVGLDSSFLLSATADPDNFLYESGLLNSPDSSTFEDDHFLGDYTQDFLSVNTHNNSNPTFDNSVDFNDFLNDNFSTNEQLQQQHLSTDIASLDASLPNPPTEDSPKDPILQPQLRASLVGCDG
jgi:transcriptional activator HAC1